MFTSKYLIRNKLNLRCCIKNLALAIGWSMLPINVSAEIYKWVDKYGTVHYSETAPGENAQPVDKSELPPINISEPVNLDSYKSANDNFTKGEYSSRTSSFSGKLLFDGSPISVSNPDDVATWIRDESTGKGTRYNALFEPATSTILVSKLPAGTYGLSVNVNTNKSNPRKYPGDFRKWIVFKIRMRKSIRVDIDLEEIIHLTLPENNNNLLRNFLGYCDKPTTYASPVRFEWAPIAQQSSYTYTIQKYTCHPLKFEGVVVEGTTLNPFVSIDLPEAPVNGFYMFLLKARSGNRLVGSLMTHGEKGYGWDYRFAVR